MRCPRCDGHLLREETDTTCLNCGYLEVDLPDIPLDFEAYRRRMSLSGIRKGRTRVRPASRGFGSGRPGFCVNGHGFRHPDHQDCMTARVTA